MRRVCLLWGVLILLWGWSPDWWRTASTRLMQSPTEYLATVAVDSYVRPDLAPRMVALRPALRTAATRHNHPHLTGLSDSEFAHLLAVILYNEQNGWFEDLFEPLRATTPVYHRTQLALNWHVPGSNYTVLPANLRPSVALEMLNHELPLPDTQHMARVPVQVAGTQIDPADYASQYALYAAITAEISDDELAVAYLAANLERGIYRARYEGVPITWETLAAWHNQGIVQPEQIAANPYARSYIERTRVYFPTAQTLLGSDLAHSGGD